MIIIYTQDRTSIYEDIKAAETDIMGLYGAKFGTEACRILRDGRSGSSYRKYGGPLIRTVSRKEADWIREKEKKAGMLAWTCNETNKNTAVRN